MDIAAASSRHLKEECASRADWIQLSGWCVAARGSEKFVVLKRCYQLVMCNLQYQSLL